MSAGSRRFKMAPRALRHKHRAVSVKCIFSAARRPQADSGKMPFISTTFPVKSESQKIRRFSGFLSIKNNFSSDIATATTAACGQRLPPAGGRCRIATKEGMQGGAVGAVASRMQGPLKGRSSRWVPQLVQSKAARILNRHAVVRLPAVPCPQTSAPQ